MLYMTVGGIHISFAFQLKFKVVARIAGISILVIYMFTIVNVLITLEDRM